MHCIFNVFFIIIIVIIIIIIIIIYFVDLCVFISWNVKIS